METLVANIGGYIGLFLGYAILQIPIFFRRMIEYVKGMISKNSEMPSDHIIVKLSSTLEQEGANKDQTKFVNELDCVNDDVGKMKKNLRDFENVLSFLKQGVQRIEQKLGNMSR